MVNNKVPTATTSEAASVDEASATCGGNISSDGGAAVTARGVVWCTSTNPEISLATKTSDGTGTGSFTNNITGLTSGVVYYIRAYATNSVGTAYGSQVSITAHNVYVAGSESNGSRGVAKIWKNGVATSF